MSTAIAQTNGKLDDQTMLLLVAGGDCSRLTPAQRLTYYNARCDAAGLDPRAQPFEFVKLNGKEVLYARKAAADQLASKHGVRVEIVSQSTDDGIRVVTVRAVAKDGRQTDEIGAVTVKGLQGDALCNAMMKAVTKAKRRAILSLCGLGMLDETEVETVPGVKHDDPPPAQGAHPNVAVTAEVLASPPEPPRPSDKVMGMWDRLVREQGGNKKLAKAAWDKAAEQVEAPVKSTDWTPEDTAAVEQVLWPSDCPF